MRVVTLSRRPVATWAMNHTVSQYQKNDAGTLEQHQHLLPSVFSFSSAGQYGLLGHRSTISVTFSNPTSCIHSLYRGTLSHLMPVEASALWISCWMMERVVPSILPSSEVWRFRSCLRCVELGRGQNRTIFNINQPGAPRYRLHFQITSWIQGIERLPEYLLGLFKTGCARTAVDVVERVGEEPLVLGVIYLELAVLRDARSKSTFPIHQEPVANGQLTTLAE